MTPESQPDDPTHDPGDVHTEVCRCGRTRYRHHAAWFCENCDGDPVALDPPQGPATPAGPSS